MTRYAMLRVLAAAGLAGQAGCSTSSSEAITDLAPDVKTGSYVSQIEIKDLPAYAPASFPDSLASALQQALVTCATGKHPLRLEVHVSKYKSENAAMTILVGSSNAIEGSARLLQPDTGAVLGDYDISTSTGGGGVIAAVAMANAQYDMTHAFASDLCKKAFGNRPNFQYAQNSAVQLAKVSFPSDAAPEPVAPQPEMPSTQPWRSTPSP